MVDLRPGEQAAFEDGPKDRAELLADADRPGGWVLLVDRIRQSYVDLDDPNYLDFEYMRTLADVLDALPPGPLRVTHVGGGAMTMARYLATSRPASPQIVLEPDEALTALVRSRLPLPRGARVRVRPLDGVAGVAGLKDASADVVLLDAFAGGRVPAELTTVEFVTDIARVLAPDGVLLANVADGPPLNYVRRVLASLRVVFSSVVLVADPAVLRGRRFGNIELAASRTSLPIAELERASAGAMFPLRVVSGPDLDALIATARPFTAADARRSPAPPDESWRVGEE